MDEVLILLPQTGVKVFADTNADDVVLIALGIDLNTLSDITTAALGQKCEIPRPYSGQQAPMEGEFGREKVKIQLCFLRLQEDDG